MLNQCNFIGNLGNDPDMRFTAGGDAVANISVACSESWKDKSTGEKKERTEWVRGVAFGKLAEVMGEYLRKGSKVFVSGKMQTRKWKDKEDKDRYTTEIVINNMEMLDSKGSNEQASSPQSSASPAPADDFDSDIPF